MVFKIANNGRIPRTFATEHSTFLVLSLKNMDFFKNDGIYFTESDLTPSVMLPISTMLLKLWKNVWITEQITKIRKDGAKYSNSQVIPPFEDIRLLQP